MYKTVSDICTQTLTTYTVFIYTESNLHSLHNQSQRTKFDQSKQTPRSIKMKLYLHYPCYNIQFNVEKQGRREKVFYRLPHSISYLGGEFERAPVYSKGLLCLYLLMYSHSLFRVNVLRSHEPSAERVAEVNTGNIFDIG